MRGRLSVVLACALTLGVLTLGGLTLARRRAQAEAGVELEVGVCTHFAQGKTQPEPLFEWAARSRISSIRDEIYWSDVERQPGSYALRGSSSRTASVFARARELGMRPLLILGYGNPLYDGGGQPSSPQGRKAFAAYGAWIATTLKDDVSYFEVWNEWNLGAGSKPKQHFGAPEAYVALLKELYPAVKAARPEGRVMAGAMGGDANGWPWMRAAIGAGLLRYADGVSIHLYNHAGPRAGGGVSELVARIRELHEILVRAGAAERMPIYVTETGWPNHVGVGHIDQDDAAHRALRLLLEQKGMPYLAGLWFYELKDGGSNPLESEQNFGVLNASYQEKPIGCMLRSVLPQLRTARVVRAFQSGPVRGQLLRTQANGELLALWLASTNPRASMKVTLRGHDLRLGAWEPACGEDWSSRLVADQPEAAQVQVLAAPALFRLGAKSSIDTFAVDEKVP